MSIDESQVERVARALCEGEHHEWEHISMGFAEHFRSQAIKAITAYQSPAEEVVKRVEALADAIESEDWGVHNDDTRAKRGTARRFRAALDVAYSGDRGE